MSATPNRKPADATAVSNNEKLFPLFSKKLSATDIQTYGGAAIKLAAWLKSDRAYYTAARPKIIGLLETAERTLYGVIGGLGNGLSSCVSNCPPHLQPWLVAYVNLLRTIIPHNRLFIEPELQQRLHSLAQRVGISVGESSQRASTPVSAEFTPIVPSQRKRGQNPPVGVLPQPAMELDHFVPDSPLPMLSSSSSLATALDGDSASTVSAAASSTNSSEMPSVSSSDRPSITESRDTSLSKDYTSSPGPHPTPSTRPLSVPIDVSPAPSTLFPPSQPTSPASNVGHSLSPSDLPQIKEKLGSSSVQITPAVSSPIIATYISIAASISSAPQSQRLPASSLPTITPSKSQSPAQSAVSSKPRPKKRRKTELPADLLNLDLDWLASQKKGQMPGTEPEEGTETATSSAPQPPAIIQSSVIPTDNTVIDAEQDSRSTSSLAPEHPTSLVSTIQNPVATVNASPPIGTSTSVDEVVKTPTDIEDIQGSGVHDVVADSVTPVLPSVDNSTDDANVLQHPSVPPLSEPSQDNSVIPPSDAKIPSSVPDDTVGISEAIVDDPLPVQMDVDESLHIPDDLGDVLIEDTPHLPISSATDATLAGMSTVSSAPDTSTPAVTPSNENNLDEVPRSDREAESIAHNAPASIQEITESPRDASPSENAKSVTPVVSDIVASGPETVSNTLEPRDQEKPTVTTGSEPESTPSNQEEVVGAQVATGNELISTVSLAAEPGAMESPAALETSRRNEDDMDLDPIPQAEDVPPSMDASALSNAEAQFGAEMVILVVQRGAASSATITMQFSITSGQAFRLAQWVNRKNTTQDLSKSLCLSLACYCSPGLTSATSREETADALVDVLHDCSPSQWPTNQRLFMDTMYKGRPASFPLSPPMLYLAPGNHIDISQFLFEGKNVIQLHQQAPMEDRTFVLHAHNPTRAQLAEADRVRMKTEQWKKWKADIVRPFDVKIDWEEIERKARAKLETSRTGVC